MNDLTPKQLAAAGKAANRMVGDRDDVIRRRTVRGIRTIDGKKRSEKQLYQARIIAQYETMRKLVAAVVEGFSPDPGTSDLDDEQRIVVRMNLGLYRDAQALQWDLNRPAKP